MEVAEVLPSVIRERAHSDCVALDNTAFTTWPDRDNNSTSAVEEN